MRLDHLLSREKRMERVAKSKSQVETCGSESERKGEKEDGRRTEAQAEGAVRPTGKLTAPDLISVSF